jgi:hypothetical protein
MLIGGAGDDTYIADVSAPVVPSTAVLVSKRFRSRRRRREGVNGAQSTTFHGLVGRSRF